MPAAEPSALVPAVPAAAPLERASVRLGMAPTTIDEGWRLATMMAKSDLVPKNFRNKVEDVLVAIQMGIEIGFAPMQALQSIAVINGRPGVWGDGFLALIMASPLYEDHDEFYEVAGERRDGLTADDLKVDTTAAVCTFHRKGKPMPVTRRFTVAQAKKANLLGKEGPWQQYPDRMLAMRARSFAGRDTFPDLLRGIRAAEELIAMTEDDAPPVPAAAPRAVHRLSETRPDTTSHRVAPDPSASAPVIVAPAADVVTTEPVGVKTVETMLGIHVVTLSNGVQVSIDRDEDASELRKFVGTDHRVRVTYWVAGAVHPTVPGHAVVGDPILKSFVIAD